MILGITAVVVASFIVVNMLVWNVFERNLEDSILSDLEKIKDVAWSKVQGIAIEGNKSRQAMIPALSGVSRSYEAYVSIEGEESVFAGKLLSKDLKEEILKESREQKALVYIEEMDECYSVTYAYPLYKEATYEGTLVVQKDYTYLHDNYEQIMRQIIRVELMIFSFMIAFIYYLLGRVTKGLRMLHQGISTVEEGVLTEQVPIRGKDEVATLSAAFNAMQDKIALQMDTILEAKMRAERLEKETKDFFNYATHEMKTPLTAIKGYGELLSSMPLEEEVIQGMLKRIVIETDRMHKLVHNMLVVAKGKQVEGEQKDFDLKELLEEVVKEYEVILEKEDKYIEQGMQEACIYGNREEIRTVCVNLIDNAIKYSTGKKIKIHMVHQEQIEVHFSNEIKVLPENISNQLLQPFVKYHYGDYTQVSSGLGLFICQELIFKNGGQLEYRIEEQTIYFTIKFNTKRMLG